MKYNNIRWIDLGVKINLSIFDNGNETSEIHGFFEIINTQLNTVEQFQAIEEAIERLRSTDEQLRYLTPVLKRYFLSDAVNQRSLIAESEKIAISIVQQPPLNGAKIALWVYWMQQCKVSVVDKNTLSVKHSSYNHLYSTQMNDRITDEIAETDAIFDRYTKMLHANNCNLRDHCIRTWIYVQGVDIHYAGMVNARKTYFEREGLNDKTHYIASTGIEGRYIYPENIVLMDAYAVEGIKTEQINYLQGLSHLNPTIEYGVTFERATAVDYGDRRHIYVSGTASIDNKGEIVHLLDIKKQIDRTLENINVLLTEGGAAMNDIAQLIVYLRDSADYELVNKRLSEVLPYVPRVIVWAPVCRPGWLIEMECIAIKAIENDNFGIF